MFWKSKIFFVIVWLFFSGIGAKSDNEVSESIESLIRSNYHSECFKDRDCPRGDFCKKPEDDEVSETPGHCESCGGSYSSMTYNYEKEQCEYCPNFRQRCYNNCCYSLGDYSGYEIRCVNDMCMRCRIDDDTSRSCTTQNYPDFTYKFIVAFAIAFSVALTSAIIYRWSFRGRRQRFLQRRISWESTTVITPVQQRTMELLQDRPPEYQTRHNYRHQMEMKTKNSSPDPVPVPTVTSTMAPPPYPGTADGENVSDNSQPPPYSRTDDSSGEKTLHI
ncbi:hypothetical protein DMENIID0001_086740 [Sergentomyia squamirostris]